MQDPGNEKSPTLFPLRWRFRNVAEAAGVVGASRNEAWLQVTRAFNVFSNRDIVMAMRKSAMARNFGWAKPALCYQQLYGRAIDGFTRQRVA